ncbi:hypothetical protein A4X13_0g1383 [Tilletia indica]|uniref:Uncharacterized protein n=1 Tax=Tilletia indica TaxID=43049 RepID=A0A177TF60_9BASI|nr:hypothetical protein A4X13_0g1383 [Tilletia indica]
MPPKQSTPAGTAAAAPEAGPSSAPAASASTSTSAPAAASTSTSASASTSNQPPKKKARISAPKSPKAPKAPKPSSSKPKPPKKTAPSASTSSSTALTLSSSSSSSSSKTPLTTLSRTATLAQKQPEACKTVTEATDVARFLEAKLRSHTLHGPPEMMLKHVINARPHTSFRRRTRGSKAVNKVDEFADGLSTDEEQDGEDGEEGDEEEDGAAALLLLGQTPVEQPARDEYGRTAVKADNLAQLLSIRREWLRERKRLLEKTLAFWQRVETLGAKQLEAPMKIAQHSLDLAANYSLPQEGLALLLKAFQGLHAALPRAKNILPNNLHAAWESFSKVVKAYHPHFSAHSSLFASLPQSHFDFLRMLASTGTQLAVMRTHFHEHVKDPADRMMRPSSAYAVYAGGGSEEEVTYKILLTGTHALNCFLVDQMSTMLGVDLGNRYRRAQQGGKDGPQQKEIAVSSAAFNPASKVHVTPAMLMKGISSLYDPIISDFKANTRESFHEIFSRSNSFITYNKLPLLSGPDWATFTAAERKLRYARLTERIEIVENEVRASWAHLETQEMRSTHYRTEEDWTAGVGAVGDYRSRLREKVGVSKMNEERVLREARGLIGGGSGGAEDSVMTDASGTAGGGGGKPTVSIPILSHNTSDVREQIFDPDGRVADALDMARCLSRLLRARFMELSKIAKPILEGSYSPPWPSTPLRALSSSLGVDLTRGHYATDAEIAETAIRFWNISTCLLDVLHAALEWLTGPEYVDLDEVSDLEKFLIEAERGVREWSDLGALSTDVARLRLKIANWIVEVRGICANEVLAVALEHVDWDMEKLRIWRPQGAVRSEESERKWAMKLGTTREVGRDGHHRPGGGPDLGSSEDERQALWYRRHMYLVELWDATSAWALRLAGFEWLNKLQTTTPFSRTKVGPQAEALRGVKMDIKLAHGRDGWEVSARRAEAVLNALRARFHSWRASVENAARLAAAAAGSGEGEEGEEDGEEVDSDPTSPIGFGGSSANAGTGTGAGGGGAGASGSTSTSTLKLPSHSFLPLESTRAMHNAYVAVRIAYDGEPKRRERLGGLVLGFRVLIDAVGLEKLGGSGSSSSRAGAGADVGESPSRAAATASTSGAAGSASTSASTAATAGGSSSATTTAAPPASPATTAAAARAAAVQASNAARRLAAQQKEKEKAKDKAKERDVKLTRLPRAGRAWKMHLISLDACRPEELKYITTGIGMALEPYMNEIRRTLSLRASTDMLPSSATTASTEGPYGVVPNAPLGGVTNRAATKRGLPIRSDAEERYGEFGVVYRERVFWLEVVRATLIGSAVILARERGEDSGGGLGPGN